MPTKSIFLKISRQNKFNVKTQVKHRYDWLKTLKYLRKTFCRDTNAFICINSHLLSTKAQNSDLFYNFRYINAVALSWGLWYVTTNIWKARKYLDTFVYGDLYTTNSCNGKKTKQTIGRKTSISIKHFWMRIDYFLAHMRRSLKWGLPILLRPSSSFVCMLTFQ